MNCSHVYIKVDARSLLNLLMNLIQPYSLINLTLILKLNLLFLFQIFKFLDILLRLINVSMDRWFLLRDYLKWINHFLLDFDVSLAWIEIVLVNIWSHAQWTFVWLLEVEGFINVLLGGLRLSASLVLGGLYDNHMLGRNISSFYILLRANWHFHGVWLDIEVTMLLHRDLEWSILVCFDRWYL